MGRVIVGRVIVWRLVVGRVNGYLISDWRPSPSSLMRDLKLLLKFIYKYSKAWSVG